jgi:hypothetical protein
MCYVSCGISRVSCLVSHFAMSLCRYVDMSICSLGGLTSCFAASSMPAQFQRALCLSPSVWWNAGEMTTIIAANYEASGVRPLAVIVEVGTQEGESFILSNYDQVEWMVNIQDMVSAWQGIGMGQTEGAYAFGTELYPSLASDLIFYTTAGGVHNLISWVDTINYGLPLMYQTKYPEENLLQRNARTVWKYPAVSDAASEAAADDSDSNSSANTTMWLIITIAALLPMNVYMVYFLLSKRFCIKTSENESDKSNLVTLSSMSSA